MFRVDLLPLWGHLCLHLARGGLLLQCPLLGSRDARPCDRDGRLAEWAVLAGSGLSALEHAARPSGPRHFGRYRPLSEVRATPHP
jgi:hypothetical protein